MTKPDWLSKGLNSIWLPYAQMQTCPAPLSVKDVEGCRIILEDGRELIDGIASWWSMCHGYKPPQIIKALKQQAETLPHVMFAGLAHEPGMTLAPRLCEYARMDRVFFSDSGSTAVEVALKMALQYWHNQGNHQKDRILGFTHGYHGDTFGAMGVSDTTHGMHKPFSRLLQHNLSVNIPLDEYGFAELEELLDDMQGQIAAMIIEPLVQGAGGMRFHSPDVLAELYRLAKTHDMLFIADEIMTGFYRTGMRFACDEAGIRPDILCLGKALTGGHITLGATLATTEIFNAFLDDSQSKALMHGPTFTANPLACAAAHASLDLFVSEPREAQVTAIEAQLREELAPCRRLPGVLEVRVKGAIGVVELEENSMDMWWFREKLLEHGVWLRPFQDVIYILPPLVVSPQELSALTRAVREVLTRWNDGAIQP